MIDEKLPSADDLSSTPDPADGESPSPEASTLDRRGFVRNAALGSLGLAGASGLVACAGGGSSGGGPSVQTSQNVSWRLASSFPRSLDTIFGSADVLSERVEAMTGGRFKIRVHPAGELVPALEVMDAVQQGTAHVGHTASYYYLGKNQALAFDTCVPFGLTSRQQTAWLTEAGGLELVNELFADFGIRTFPAGNTGTQMGGWYREPVETAADLQGLKIRMPGLGGEVMSRLGATVQVISGGEIYPALERGAIDAAEWVGPYDDHKLGFHKVAKNYYYPGWWEPGPSLSYLVQEEAWSKLPKEYQEIFQSAAAESATVMQARYDALNPAALTEILASGVQIRRFSDEIMTVAQEASFGLYEERASEDPAYAKIYEHWKAFRKESFRWAATAEAAFAAFAFPKV